MTPAEAIGILKGPRREELQALIDDFMAWGGSTIFYHPRAFHFGALLLWIEERGAHLSGGPEEQVAVGDHRENEGEKKGE